MRKRHIVSGGCIMFARMKFILLVIAMWCVACGSNRKPSAYILDYQTRSALARESSRELSSASADDRGRTMRYAVSQRKGLTPITTPDEDAHHIDSFMSIANAALKRSGYTVVNKNIKTPSGDPHDFFTMAPYYWPDPTKPDGIPYIHKDGQTNPEIRKYQSHATLFNVCRDVKALGIAYQHTGEEKYAQQAAKFTRKWFFDEETRMNPNLKYAQHIPGRTDGRGIGLIDVYYFVDLIDGIQLINTSESWSMKDMQNLKGWFREFLDWMLTSKQGLEAAKHKNNIGTYYDMQVVAYALFTDQQALARQTIRDSVIPRIDVQFEKDGRQPLEVERTRGWSYAQKNLQGWFYLAMLADKVGVDLWNYRTPLGKSVKAGFNWMLQYADGQLKWPYKQITGANMESFKGLVLEASVRYPDVNHRVINVRPLKK